MVAVNKPAGQLVHPSDTPQEGDLVTMKILRDQIGQQVFTVHRLDCPTCGCLLFALGQESAATLHEAFRLHRVKKVYLAVVLGKPERERWTCHMPLAKSPSARAKDASTEFRLLAKSDSGISLVAARPHSGRFHQIRRHLELEGYPIVGDFRYLEVERCARECERLGVGTRMLLQAHSLDLHHPLSSEPLKIEAPIDPLIAGLFPAAASLVSSHVW